MAKHRFPNKVSPTLRKDKKAKRRQQKQTRRANRKK